MLDSAFVLGGLAGLPFVGQTSMTAYAHHVPDDGTAFIFYGPHIGISPDGELGSFCRRGRAEFGISCGALMAALNQLQADTAIQTEISTPATNDLQQGLLTNLLRPY